MNCKKYLSIIFLISQDLIARSIHRPIDPKIGYMKVKLENENNEYKITDSHLKEFPLFKTYNHDYYISKQLPAEIELRNSQNKKIQKDILEKHIENLLKEIKEKKQKYSNFKILKNRDFNRFSQTGCLVLKFKDHPFILKLFLENPESFSKPYSKSFQVRGVFILGGTFRHVMGYTRIRNLELIQQKVAEHPYWSKHILFPRKWFWVPKDFKWLEIKGYNLGGKEQQEIKIPNVYAVICDQINENQKNNKKMQNTYLQICNYLDLTLDPNPNNFMTNDDENFVIIDTEHFTTLIGIKNKFRKSTDYLVYYTRLVEKYMKDRWFSLKNVRRERQKNSKTEFPLFND